VSERSHRFLCRAWSSGRRVTVTVWGQTVSVTGGDTWRVAFGDIISASVTSRQGRIRTEWYCEIGVRDAGWRSLRLKDRTEAERLATVINAAVEGQRQRAEATTTTLAEDPTDQAVSRIHALLLSLTELHRAGVLTEEEYAAKKEELLRRI
jgi:hypothetical protein